MPDEDQENKKVEGKPEKAQAEESKAEPEEGESDLKDRLLRLAAEFDNYKKRVAKDIANSKDMGRADAVSKLLPTLDEFELAINSFDKKDEHMKGISLVYSNFLNTLNGLGLREIEAVGKFDPYRHEIMLAKQSSEEDGTIIEVVRKGYMLNSVMLRPASVIVAKNEGSEKKDEGKGDKENDDKKG
ncbi:MAG: nucleotide exchange factor GrpE [Candidatus Micrarchaeota archaeon]|nr:nucleotide exchange factor GrpE [Candidatus Micrarchaeota archaeon]